MQKTLELVEFQLYQNEAIMAEQLTLEVIFGKQTESIFQDKTVLNESYIPSVIPHRKDQILQLAERLKDAIHSSKPSDLILYGKTGTGKTLSAKYATENLLKYDKSNNIHVVYVNLKREISEFGALCALITALNKSSIKRHGLSTGEVYERFWNSIQMFKGVVIIILDEIDAIKERTSELLYNLLRPPDIDGVQTSLILISNVLNFTDELDERVKSSLGGSVNILFPPYDAVQLIDIIAERAKLALKEKKLEETIIPLCAALAAQEHGDARRAIQLLREAALIADLEKAEKVTEKHIKQATKNIELNRVHEGIVTLPLQSKIVLAACINFNLKTNNKETNLNTGEHYRLYKEACSALGTNALTPRRVYDLINELNMLGIINIKFANRGRRGITREITINVPDETIIETLSKDDRIQTILSGSSFSKVNKAVFP